MIAYFVDKSQYPYDRWPFAKKRKAKVVGEA